MIYLRGHRADFDEWAAWLRRLVVRRGAPYFKRSEDNERGASEFHGVGGPLTVSDSRSMCPLIEAELEAAVHAGYAHIEDLNVDRPRASHFQLTQRNGMRCSPADAFLRPAEGGRTSRFAQACSSSGSSSRATAPSGSSSSATASARRSGPSAR